MTILNLEPKDYSKKAISYWIKNGFNYIEHNLDSEVKGKDIDILITRLKFQISTTFLKKYPNVKYIISPTTGITHIDLEAIQERKIQLFTLRDHYKFLETIPSTAEFTFGLLICLLRNIPSATNDVISGFWNRDMHKGWQLKNKTLGILGLGRIGKMVAKYGKAFEMDVVYTDPKVNSLEFKKVDLNRLFATSDIISIHIHSDKENLNFINSDSLEKMKNNVILLNTSRGEIWNEKDISEAIINGRISGVATDVLTNETTDLSKNPLWEIRHLPNVIITPHIGGASQDAMWECEEHLQNEVIKYINKI